MWMTVVPLGLLYTCNILQKHSGNFRYTYFGISVHVVYVTHHEVQGMLQNSWIHCAASSN